MLPPKQPNLFIPPRNGLITILLAICCTSFSQSSHPIFEHLTTANGLSSDKVEAIIQDREGFYWISTQNGLNRYDGTHFKVFRHNTEDTTSLSNNYCTALLEDRNGDIWVATFKGVSRFIKSKGIFQRIYLHHPTRNFEITNRIYNLALDSDGNVWIAGNGFWKYDIQQERVTLYTNNTNDPHSIPPYSQITQLIYDPFLKGLWFITGNELAFYSTTEQQFYHRHNNPLGWKVFALADSRELVLDKKNRLWFRDSGTQVLSYFESNTNQVTLTTKKVTQGIKQLGVDDKNRIWIFYWLVQAEILDPEMFAIDSVFFSAYHRRSALSEQGTYLFVDGQKNYWIASGKGISIYQEAHQYYKLHHLQIHEPGAGKEPVKINALSQQDSSILWIASNAGLFKYDLRSGKARYVPVHLPIQAVNTILYDDEKLWIVIHDRLLCMNTRNESIIKNIWIGPGIFFICRGYAQDLWVGLWGGGLFQLNVETAKMISFKKGEDQLLSLKTNNLICGMVDGPDFWLGYNAGMGFSKYSTLDKIWSHYHPQQNDLSNSNAGTITVITKDSKAMLWLGTHGSGIFQFDPTLKTFTNYQQQNGLNSNYINSILPDQNDNLWVSTADGINFLSAGSHSIIPLDIDLIFPDNDFTANGIRGSDSKMYFFCNDEFVEVDPEAFQPDKDFPKMVISTFKVFDREIPMNGARQEIQLSFKQNFFSFEYSSIKTQPALKVNYAYKLEGFDKDWNTDDRKQMAAYTNVPDGDYIFKVRATNSAGQWSNDLISILVDIKPPFWRTWWFIAMVAVTLGYMAYAFHRYRIAQVKKLYSVRTQISRDLHDDIGGSLSSINIYSTVAENELTENPEKAKEFLQQINSSSRQVMEDISDIVWANNTDQQEKSTLANRIKNYGYDLLAQKNIECRYTIDPEAEKKLTKPEARRNILLIIKEALNNMAKYSEASYAEVCVQLNDSQLLIDISDNGKGFDITKNGDGNGLHNMQERTGVLGGIFHMNSSPGQGTTIQCRIPIPNISDR